MIVIEMPLLEGSKVLASNPRLDFPIFHLMCILKPASSIKTQLAYQSISLSRICSNTLSFRCFKVPSDILPATILSSFLRVRGAC
jgi:hypothetical protein